ncbi:hypothetical protein K438DRAFT_1775139 [Mycena galopus ATCC 62051]|nr:hypothetical protein K438DRAFT_1775139 [Mycena galopus ATCC 62051]
MAMRSARICAIDHSHKIAKHVFKVDGVPIFTALLTVTNQKAEICVCVFVATKSHSQYEEALRRLANDLPIYGHELPEVFYTDNMSDKPMLEKIFPSLRAAFAVKSQLMGILLLDLMQNGMEMWHPMDVCLSRKALPEQLVNLLRSSQVIKAGRQVSGDLQRLATAAGYAPTYFRGADEHGIEMISVTEGLNMADSDDVVPDSDADPSHDTDAAGGAEGERILGPAVLQAYAWLIRSRVLKDVFHVFHMIYISRTHGLRQAFCQALRDAILIPHPADKALIETYLKAHNVTWENMRQFHPKWLWRHCRRTIPPAEELYPGLPLFNTAAWKIAKNILELIKHGYVSDPPGVQLYYCLGFDKKAGGLPIYRCVGHFNSTGHKYLGHDSIWLLNEIQELEITLGEHYDCLPAQLAWVNGNLYKKTEQTAGIIQIPKSVRELVRIQPFNPETDSNQKQSYLAKMQGTRKPVLPVHTLAEKREFADLMRTSPTFQKCSTSISLAAVEIWNQKAESTTDIYHKLEEQLTAYLNGPYKDSANIRQSCAQARGQTDPLRISLQDPQRTAKIVNTTSGPLVPDRVTAGFEQFINSVQCLLYLPQKFNSLQMVKIFHCPPRDPPSRLAKSV